MWALSLPIPFPPPLHAGAGGYFAPHIRSYIRRAKAPDHIGMLVALKDRQNALKNPYAHLHEHDITLRLHQGLDDAVGPDPLRRDLPVVATAPARWCSAARRSATPPRPTVARRRGSRARRCVSEPTMSAERDTGATRSAAALCAADVYEQAGITDPRKDVDCVEMYVPFSLVRADVAREPRLRRARRRLEDGRGGRHRPRRRPAGQHVGRRAVVPTPSARRACSASPRPPCRCGARPASTRSTAPARRVGHAYGGGSQFFAMWVVGADKP